MAKTTKSTKADETTPKKPAAKKAEAPKKTAKAADGEKASAKASESKEKKTKKPGAVSGKRAPLAPKTYYAPWGSFASKWKLVDAEGQTLGRISSYVAGILMGKHIPQYTRHAATGDFVIVVNAAKVVVTGKKLDEKVYQWHTGYPGGVKTISVREMLAKHPERVIERAVYGMLPKGHVGRQWGKRLRVFAGAEHNHKAQQPEVLTLPNLGVSQKTA